MMKNEQYLRDQCSTTKCINTHITGVPEREMREKGAERTFEKIMA